MSEKQENQRTPGESWMLAIFLAHFLNFFTFLAVSGLLGGDALNGRQESGKYYVGSHGKYTEASPRLYAFSRLQAVTTITLHLPALVCLCVVASRWKRKTTSMWRTAFSLPQWTLILGLPAFWWGAFLIVKTV